MLVQWRASPASPISRVSVECRVPVPEKTGPAQWIPRPAVPIQSISRPAIAVSISRDLLSDHRVCPRCFYGFQLVRSEVDRNIANVSMNVGQGFHRVLFKNPQAENFVCLCTSLGSLGDISYWEYGVRRFSHVTNTLIFSGM